MNPVVPKPQRCAIYTRKSSEHNLDLEFNSLDAQREACEAYIKSQAHEGWRLNPDRYDDGGLSGASLDRPALQQLLTDVRAGKITIVVVYKVDRLTRSLADFAKLVECPIIQRAFNELVSGNSRTSLRSPETEIGKKLAETGRPKPASNGQKCRKLLTRDRGRPA
jgi:hypothetical protein